MELSLSAIQKSTQVGPCQDISIMPILSDISLITVSLGQSVFNEIWLQLFFGALGGILNYIRTSWVYRRRNYGKQLEIVIYYLH